MNSKERIENLFLGKPIDRVGLNDFFWDETLKEWIIQGYPQVERADEFASHGYLEDESGDTAK